ncbi:MAG: UTRA domain-containing protein [Nocardioides sp.]
MNSFVRTETRFQRRSRGRYSAARARPGLLNDTFRHQIVAAGEATVPGHIAPFMELDTDETIVVRRRHLYDEHDHLQEIGASYLPLAIAQGTYLAEPQVVPQALFRCIEELTGRPYRHATDQWIARPATVEEIDSFDTAIGAHVLHVIHVARDESNAVLEVSESIWPADRITLIDDYDIPSEPEATPTKSDI